MFREILRTQWKWARLLVLAACVAAFSLPIFAVQPLGYEVDGWTDGTAVLRAMRSFSTMYALLAGAVGLAIGISAWSADHRGRHVYALSLPVSRSRFALMRLGAGALLVMLPAVSLWIGALTAVASVSVPPGLEAFPTSLAIRFLLASMLAYAIFFSIASGTARTAGWVLGVLTGVLLLGIFGGEWAFTRGITGQLEMLLLTWPGVLEVFTGRWMLIDV